MLATYFLYSKSKKKHYQKQCSTLIEAKCFKKEYLEMTLWPTVRPWFP